jgi:hypothetical protein
MDYRSRYLLLFLISLILISCATKNSNKNYPELEKAQWLLGKWRNSLPEGDLIEFWVPENDSTLAGMGFMVVDQDTIFSDEVYIQQIDKDLYYISIDRSTGKPVEFRLTSSAEKLLVFENLDHDFPQKISYQQLSDDSLIAEISGLKDGKNSFQKFPMQKSK